MYTPQETNARPAKGIDILFPRSDDVANSELRSQFTLRLLLSD